MAWINNEDLRSVIVHCSENVKDSGDVDTIYDAVKEYKETFKPLPADKLKLFNDPIHGSIQLNPLEDAILNTPEFYRLRDIKQLGGKSHVYPGAVHTRFEHSIGVCHLAGEFVKHLRHSHQPKGKRAHEQLEDNQEQAELTCQQGEQRLSELISDEQEYCIRIAGLCHDLGHGPFSHVFDLVTKEIEKIEREKKREMRRIKHEKMSTLMFQRILLENPEVLLTFVSMGLKDCHVQLICDMIDCSAEFMKKLQKDDRQKKTMYLYEIVANKLSGLDVDKWDYFARDCYFLGVKNDFDSKRCMTLSRIIEYDNGRRHIGFRNKEYENIYGMFRTRCMIHQKACSHKKVCALEMMIKDAIVAARNVKLFPNSQSLMDILRTIPDGKLSGYIWLSDNILSKIRECTLSEAATARSLVDRIIERKCYCTIAVDDEKKEFEIVFPQAGHELNKKTIEKIEAIHHLKYPAKSKQNEGYEIDCASISYASEEKDDPVQDVHFYPKQEQHSINIVKLGQKYNPQKSQVTTPKSLVEYRVRLFKKRKRTSNNKNDKKAIEWFKKKVPLARNEWFKKKVPSARKQARHASKKSKQAGKASEPGRQSRRADKASRRGRQGR